MKSDHSSVEKPDADRKAELREKLTPQQFACTQESATERPFANAYWDNHQPGIYVDVVDHAPLFLSSAKFDSHSGWPSFFEPAEKAAVVEHRDSSHGMIRQEVQSSLAKSHLGHVFDDGPGPTHKRYCINSASLLFIPAEKMRDAGFERFMFALRPDLGWQEVYLAGGCFWGVEELIAETPGVMATEVGYAGGARREIGYEQVSTGMTGHAEAVRVLFDPKKISLERVLQRFFALHDPTTVDRQANDRGSQYRSAIFTTNQEQQKEAVAFVEKMSKAHTFSAPIVTKVQPLPFFIRGEDYHQHYLDKHPHGYRCHVVRPLTFPQ